MIPALLAPILSTLAANGLGMLSGAIQAKGKEFIEEKIGMKIPSSPSELTPELLQELKIREIDHEEFLLEMQVRQAELNLEEIEAANENTANAREMNTRIQESSDSSDLAKNAAYYLDFIIISATLLLVALVFFVDLSLTNEKLAYMALGSLLTLCGTIINFHRGTSASSKGKDDTINSMMKK